MPGTRCPSSKNRLALSYGKTEDDGNGVVGSGADYETRGIALFHDVNESLTRVAEYKGILVTVIGYGLMLVFAATYWSWLGWI